MLRCRARFALAFVLAWVPGRAFAQMVMPIPDLCAGSVDTIPAGQTVTLSGSATKGCLGIHGTVLLADGVRLTADTIYVYADGTLATVNDPASGIDIAITDKTINTSADPEQYGAGLIGLGTIRLKGVPVTPFLRVASEPKAGETTLALVAPPIGWSGARLVLPGTNRRDPNTAVYTPQWEELSAAAVAGSQVTLSVPLAFDHLGARDADGGLTFTPHVANLSRTIVIRSSNPAGTRGHVLFSKGANVDIEYVAFKDLGRTRIAPLDSTTFNATGAVTHLGTNQIGRYPLHMHHHVGPVTPQVNGYQFTLVGNAIDGGSAVHAFKWGIAVHNSHYGLVSDNVVYNTAGGGIVGEDGSETENLIARNIVIRSTSTYPGRGDERLAAADFAWEGSAFWFRGPLNLVRDNIAADSTAYGYKLFMYLGGPVPTPAFKGADPSLTNQMIVRSTYQSPLSEFAGNEAYAGGGTGPGSGSGLTIWWLCANSNSGFSCPRSTVRGFKSWAQSSETFWGYDVNALTLDSFVVRGDPAFIQNPNIYDKGIHFADYFTQDVVISRADIQNLETCIVSPTMTNGTFTISDSTLRCTHGIVTRTIGAPGNQPAGPMNPRSIAIINVKFGASKTGPEPILHIEQLYDLQQGAAWLVTPDETRVTAYNGLAGDDFKVYYLEQAGSFVVPQTAGQLNGSPDAGLTNDQNWLKNHLAIAGAVAPCSTIRTAIKGFVCAAGK